MSAEQSSGEELNISLPSWVMTEISAGATAYLCTFPRIGGIRYPTAQVGRASLQAHSFCGPKACRLGLQSQESSSLTLAPGRCLVFCCCFAIRCLMEVEKGLDFPTGCCPEGRKPGTRPGWGRDCLSSPITPSTHMANEVLEWPRSVWGLQIKAEP